MPTSFERLVRTARDELPTRAAVSTALHGAAVAAADAIDQRLARFVAPAVRASADDIEAQLRRLVRPGFVTATGTGRLDDVLRYLRGIDRRLDKLPDDPARDQRRLRDVVALERRYAALLDRLERGAITPEVIELGWSLEELRISEFAQVIGTARPVSPAGIAAELTRLGG